MPRKPGYVPTEAQRAGLVKGKETQRKRAKAAREAGAMPAKERWAMLLSGTLLVSDLDDDEIKKMRVRSRDGSFTGRPRPLPSHIAQQFAVEAQRRAKKAVDQEALGAIQRLVKMAEDPDAPHAVRKDIDKWLAERVLGKTPDVVRHEGASAFDRVSAEAVDLVRVLVDDPGDLLDADGAT